MSLEQALIDATAAITRLTTVLVTASEAGAVAAPEKATRSKKAAEPVSAAPAPTPSPAPETPAVATPAQDSKALSGYLLEGDPVGTRYFHIPEHNTVYKQLPGMADCTIQGALIVSGQEYLKQQAELAKKFPTAAAPAPVTAAPATTVPTATAPASAPVEPASVAAVLSFEQVVEKMRALFKAQGDAGVKKVLDKFGAAKVPMLNGKASNDEIAAFIDSVSGQ